MASPQFYAVSPTSTVRRHLIALLLLTTLWGAANWRLLTPVTVDQWSINSGDFTDQMFTFSSYQAERLSSFQIPAWWPRNNGGQPFIADPQMAAFYPVRLIFIALSGGHWTLGDLQAEAVFSLLLAGLFTYSSAYLIARSFLGAFTAGVIIMASGLLTGYPIQQLPILESFIWLPLAIGAIQMAGLNPRRRYRWLTLCGAAIGLSYLAGHVQTVLMISYLCLAFWGFWVYRSKDSVLVWIGGAIVIGGVAVGLSAVQMFPGLEFMALSTRSDTLTFADKATGLTFGSLLQAIWPGIVSYFSPLYIGLATWAAIAVGVMLRDRATRFWSGAAAIAGLLSFGGGTITFTFAYWLLPGLSLFRDQERFALIAVFALAMLAAFGIRAIVTGQIAIGVIRGLRRAALLVVVLTGIVAFGLSLWTFGGGGGNPIAHLDSAMYAFLVTAAGTVIVFQLRTVERPVPTQPTAALADKPSPATFPPRTGFGSGSPPPGTSDTSGTPPRPTGLFGSRPSSPPTPPSDDRSSRMFGPFSSFPPDERPPSPFGNLPGKPRVDPPEERPNPFRPRPPVPPDDRDLPPDDRPTRRFTSRPDVPPDDRDLPPARPFGSGSDSTGGSSGRSIGDRSTNPFSSSGASPFGAPRGSAGGSQGASSGNPFGSRPGGASFGSGNRPVPPSPPPPPRPAVRPPSVTPPASVGIGVAIALVVLIAFDLLTWANSSTPSFSATPVQQTLDTPGYLAPILADQTAHGAWRVDGARALTPRASLFQLSDVFGASPLQLASTAALTKLPVDRYWDLFAVRYVISSSTLPVASTTVAQGSDSHGAFTVQQLTDPRPYAQLAYAYDVNPNMVFDRQLLADPKFPIRDKVILNSAPSIVPGSAPAIAPSAVITAFAPETITVVVNSSANALLTLALPYYPGWQATIDNLRAPILEGDTAFSTVAVPAGTHIVQLRFIPLTVTIGGIVSLITLALLITMLVRWMRQRKPIVTSRGRQVRYFPARRA